MAGRAQKVGRAASEFHEAAINEGLDYASDFMHKGIDPEYKARAGKAPKPPAPKAPSVPGDWYKGYGEGRVEAGRKRGRKRQTKR